MKTKTTKTQSVLTGVLTALILTVTLLLAGAVLAGGDRVSYAETELFIAPLDYEYVAPTVEGEKGSYTLVGVDFTDKDSWSDLQKQNIKIVVPATFNDEVNGEAPVTTVAPKAFSLATNSTGKNPENEGLTFRSIDFSQALNLTFIDQNAFCAIKSNDPLILPENLKKIGYAAFWDTEFPSLKINEQLEYINHGFIKITIHEGVHLPKNYTTYDSSGGMSLSNQFYNNRIPFFTVDEENEHFKAVDGIIYSKDGTRLISYPGSKDKVEVFRVPDSVKILENNCFSYLTNIGGIIVPDSVDSMNYAFVNSKIEFVYLSKTEGVTIMGAHHFASDTFSGKVVIKDSETFDIVSAEGGILIEALKNLTYINAITATFDAGDDIIDTNANAEQLKKYFTLTGSTESGITGIPLYDHTLTLPEGGLVVGSNDITVSLGSNSTTVNIKIKNSVSAPAAPALSGTPTSDSITLTAIEGAEYSMDGGKTWQESPTFTGLAPNTQYSFIARIKATDKAYAYAASEPIIVKTAAVGGLTGGAIAGIVIACILLAGILALLSLFFFRKEKSQTFKEFYIELGGNCAASVKGWGGKIKGAIGKEQVEKPTETLRKENTEKQVPAKKSEQENTEEQTFAVKTDEATAQPLSEESVEAQATAQPLSEEKVEANTAAKPLSEGSGKKQTSTQAKPKDSVKKQATAKTKTNNSETKQAPAAEKPDDEAKK